MLNCSQMAQALVCSLSAGDLQLVPQFTCTARHSTPPGPHLQAGGLSAWTLCWLCCSIFHNLTYSYYGKRPICIHEFPLQMVMFHSQTLSHYGHWIGFLGKVDPGNHGFITFHHVSSMTCWIILLHLFMCFSLKPIRWTPGTSLALPWGRAVRAMRRQSVRREKVLPEGFFP